jgi:hypothetical protein
VFLFNTEQTKFFSPTSYRSSKRSASSELLFLFSVSRKHFSQLQKRVCIAFPFIEYSCGDIAVNAPGAFPGRREYVSLLHTAMFVDSLQLSLNNKLVGVDF